MLRFVNGAPPPIETGRAAAILARISHAAFYVLLVAVPVTGILDYYFHLPTGELHELGKPLFFVLIALHVAATLRHQFIRHDGTLRRMVVPGQSGRTYITPAPWVACQTSQAPSQIIFIAT